jgi:hypothetical protein
MAISSPDRKQAELEEKKQDAAESRRLHKLIHTDQYGFLREIGLDSGERKPPEPIKRRRI